MNKFSNILLPPTNFFFFSGSSSRGLIVKDRVCRIDLAVDRESAQRLKSDNKSAIANDKRNMYLANEGTYVC